ncbi:hypothetical protein BDV32DRAFT_126415 [Aspergillus pseudonomiae]|nr:hypothetical protein BDV32DRAFT_126415 [Aspergillus pseudonomiae]
MRMDERQCIRRNSNSKTLGLNIQSPSRAPRAKKRRSRAASQSPQSKSVAFDLSSEDGQQLDPGYETDDSDSTIGSISGVRRHGHRQHHSSRTESEIQHMATEKKPRSNTSGKEIESDSDSTIDLPDRFDSQGRLLPQREGDMFADGLDSLLRGFNKVFV